MMIKKKKKKTEKIITINGQKYEKNEIIIALISLGIILIMFSTAMFYTVEEEKIVPTKRIEKTEKKEIKEVKETQQVIVYDIQEKPESNVIITSKKVVKIKPNEDIDTKVNIEEIETEQKRNEENKHQKIIFTSDQVRQGILESIKENYVIGKSGIKLITLRDEDEYYVVDEDTYYVFIDENTLWRCDETFVARELGKEIINKDGTKDYVYKDKIYRLSADGTNIIRVK